MKTGRSKKKSAKEPNSFFTFTVWFIILVIIGFFGRNYVVKLAAEFVIKNSLGTRVSINGIDIGIAKSTFTIKGLTVYNPAGFPGTLAKIPYVYVRYDRDSILKKKPYFQEIELNVYEVTVAKNHNQEVNLNRLKAITDRTEESFSIKKKEKMKIKIDTLILTAGYVNFGDYTKEKASRRHIKLGLNREKFHDLKSLDEIARLVITRVISKSGLGSAGLYYSSQI